MMIPIQGRKIIAFVHRLSLRQLVEEAAAELEAEVVWTLDTKQVVKQVAEMRPLAILVHLALLDEVARTIQALRTSPATRRIRVIAFDHQVDDTLLHRASKTIYQDNYFDARDGLTGNMLASMIRDNIDEAGSDLPELHEQCFQPMPPLVKNGLEEFNAGEYYECHETLETAWMEETGPVRDVYRGILQVAVAYYQIQRGNYNGAMKMFLRSLQWLDPLPDKCHGIEIARFRADALAARRAMEALGAERIKEFDPNLLKPIIYDI